MSAKNFDRQTDEIIERVDWAVIGVSPDEGEEEFGAFAYTVGLTAKGLPELAVAGLGQSTMQSLLNDLAQQVVAGLALSHGHRLSNLVEGYDLVLVDGTACVDRNTIWPGVALERYGSRLRLFQIVWPDRSRRFPWDDGYKLPAWLQPVLSTLNHDGGHKQLPG